MESSLINQRRYHQNMGSSQDLLLSDPFDLFAAWFKQAEESEPNDPNAASLATSTPDGIPSVRMVLVKRVNRRGFCFFTNAESKKGKELEANPKAALCFHWKTLRRQVRVGGAVTLMDDADVDTYFHSRSRASQIGAAVSLQSRPLASRELLETKYREFAQNHPGEVPRPSYWRGFCLFADQIEFWLDGPDRLHDRFVFSFDSGAWKSTRLYP